MQRCHPPSITELILLINTRMHSSRMRTVRSSGRLLGGVCPGGGVSAREGVHPSMHWGRHPPPVDRMTDRCKNITFPQLRLRTVIMSGLHLLKCHPYDKVQMPGPVCCQYLQRTVRFGESNSIRCFALQL